MKLKTKRLIDKYAGQVICLFLDIAGWIAGWIRRNRQAGPASPEHICIILLSEMGSLTLAAPMFRFLREHYPHADLHILTLRGNAEIVRITALVPDHHILTIDDRSITTFARDSIRVLNRLRAMPVDTVIDCELFARVSGILSYLSNAAIRVGFHCHTQEGLYRGNRINRPVLYNPHIHISSQFLSLARAITSETVPRNKAAVDASDLDCPRVILEKEEKKQMATRITSMYPLLFDRPVIAIHPGGGDLPIRAWPVAHYTAVAQALVASGFSIALTGLETDAQITEQISTSCGSPYCGNLTGVTRSVRELLVVMGMAKLLITNDGGPGHFSSLVRLPGIVLFGPETPVLYGPLGKKTVNLKADVSCSPCLTAFNHRESPCDGNNYCLTCISPDRVLSAAYDLLAENGTLRNGRETSPARNTGKS